MSGAVNREINLDELRKEINELAHKKGWWKDFNLDKKLLLIISEVIEAMEADRVDNYCSLTTEEKWKLLEEEDNIKFSTIFENLVKHTYEDELADIDIRTNDLAYEVKVNMKLHIALKHRYNSIPKESKKRY